MRYTHSLPPIRSFDGKGLFGYTFGPLKQKDVDVYYIEVDGGHDTFMVSRKITRIYYVLQGDGYFTIGNRKYDVSSGMLVEVPPKVEYSYSGRMKLVVFARPGWFAGNDTHTKWNRDAIGHKSDAPLPNGSRWRRYFGLGFWVCSSVVINFTRARRVNHFFNSQVFYHEPVRISISGGG